MESEPFRTADNYLDLLRKYGFKLWPGKYDKRMPEEYCMAIKPPDDAPDAWPYPSMVVDEAFTLP